MQNSSRPLADLLELPLADLDGNECAFLVISGDLTQEAKPQEFNAAQEFVEQCADSIPDKSHVLAVPGNHDVLWEEDDKSWRLTNWEKFASDAGIETPSQDEWPLIRAFGSHNEIVVVHLNSNSFIKKKDDVERDRGRLGDYQVSRLDEQIHKLVWPTTWLRIAIVHHHPILSNALKETGRGVDSIFEGTVLMNTLRRHQFHMVLHGHKHTPHWDVDHSKVAGSSVNWPIAVYGSGSTGSENLPQVTPNAYATVIAKKKSQSIVVSVATSSLRTREGPDLLPVSQWRWEPVDADQYSYPLGTIEFWLRMKWRKADGGEDTLKVTKAQKGRLKISSLEGDKRSRTVDLSKLQNGKYRKKLEAWLSDNAA